ncbi:hypothetical protein G9H64_05400 [Aquirufa nivalisilvae]|uniref:Lipopolysaccharide biosynthesis protein n=1 Tax=Aquirufa nivalisilvae TaxID=2516557 RepID=A0A2S2DVI3_9BACT|nr:hypothetical protein [Aquirufa nivalisilvae]AWL09282.1 hypothetical protein HME7025_01425 [Aquirufa nivalisilvae]MCZ2480221.1 hypothetical protein [Aquirufa nivalisilvae]MCZ2482384.1 hypothetical protein [Aquirufa nivalisilvae]
MAELRSDQFSFKRLLFKCFLLIPFFKKNRKKLLIGAFIGFAAGISVEIIRSQNKIYKAQIVFVMDSEGSSGGGLADIASSLGLGGFTASNSLFSGENFKELLKTKALFRKALLTRVKFGDKEDLFANFFLQKADLKKHEWSDLPDDFFNYRFKISDPSQANEQDRNIMNAIYEYLKGNTVISNENPKSSFLTMTVETRNDTLSYTWSKLYLKTVTEFYIQTKTKKSKELLVIMDKRVDSLRSALYYTQGKLANYNDQNQQIIYQRARITAERLQMNSSQLQSMYFEAVRNFDNLKFSLIKESPLFTIISDSELPTKIEVYFWGPITLVAVVIGMLITSLLIYIGSVYRELMA